jgi:hypothetical protein
MRRPLLRAIFDAPLLVAAGSALLLSTLDLAWYVNSLGACCETWGETFYLTSVQVWNSGIESTSSGVTSYSSVGLAHTEILYLVITGFVIAGGVLGFCAAYLIRRNRNRAPRRWVSGLVVLTVILALAAPVLMVVAQPAAVCSDSHVVSAPLEAMQLNVSGGASLPCGWNMAYSNGDGGYGPGPLWSTPGPQSSLFGGENLTGYWHSWAPSIGWYVALAASVLLLVGAVQFWRLNGNPRRTERAASSPENREGAPHAR